MSIAIQSYPNNMKLNKSLDSQLDFKTELVHCALDDGEEKKTCNAFALVPPQFWVLKVLKPVL